MGTSGRRLLGRCALAWLLGFAGNGAFAQARPAPVELDRRVDVAGTELRDISGSWRGTFSVDSTWGLAERPSARSVPAHLHFNPVGDASPATSSTRSVHRGTFEIDFTRFGFTVSTAEALGWSVSADSMRAVLNPTVNHGLVEVHGTFRGDAIVGTWRYRSDPGGARGTFELRKVTPR
jgi:hypothetical protein